MVSEIIWVTDCNLLPPTHEPVLVTVDPSGDVADRYLDIVWYNREMDYFTMYHNDTTWTYLWRDIVAWAYAPTVYRGDRTW